MLTLDNLYQRAKADLESFAQAREGAVHHGAATAELAGLLTQKYGYGLAKALQLAAELSDLPNPSLLGDVDRCVARIDPHWRTTFDLRIQKRPAALQMTPPGPDQQ
jgi:hypothetical protein